MSLILKFIPGVVDLSFLYSTGFSVPNAEGVYEIPFVDRMMFVFIFCILGMALISLIENRRGVKPRGLEVDAKMFRVHPAFLVGTIIVLGIIAALYTIFW